MPFIAFLFAVFLFIYAELSLLVWLGSHLGIMILILLLIFATRNRDYGLSEDWLRTR